MKISIIIPVKPGGLVGAIEALRRLEAPSANYEVLVAEGRQPSRQRNLAAARASGEILYFLDDDAAAVPDALERIEPHFANSTVAVVGGPSITPSNVSSFQRAIAWSLASLLGGGAVRNRYRQYGEVREADDSELILCNLAFRREVFIANGGLDERLYPNEENKLMDELIARGEKLLHDPELIVYRGQRSTVTAFTRQMITYGRGRAEQSILARRFSFRPMIPALFICYLLTVPFVMNCWYLLPGVVYAAAVMLESARAWLKSGSFALACRLPMVYPLLHVGYGAGFIAGLVAPRFKRRGAGPEGVEIRIVKMMGIAW